MQSSIYSQYDILWLFLVLKASICVLVFPHIVCIYLYRSVSVYHHHPFSSVFVASFLPLYSSSRPRRPECLCPNSIWLRSFHHGPRCYSRVPSCLCPSLYVRYGVPPCVSCISHVSILIFLFIRIFIRISHSLLSSLSFFFFVKNIFCTCNIKI